MKVSHKQHSKLRKLPITNAKGIFEKLSWDIGLEKQVLAWLGEGWALHIWKYSATSAASTA